MSDLNRVTQTNYLQAASTKSMLYLFHGQDEHQIRIFWAFLVLFGLRTMHKEGICEVQIYGFTRSKSSNLKGWKIWHMLRQISLYLRKSKYLVKEVNS